MKAALPLCLFFGALVGLCALGERPVITSLELGVGTFVIMIAGLAIAKAFSK